MDERECGSDGLEKETIRRTHMNALELLVFLSAAALAPVSAIASWLTVRSSDTAPGPSDVSSTSSMALPLNRLRSQRSKSEGVEDERLKNAAVGIPRLDP
jgi:hypothetical protein